MDPILERYERVHALTRPASMTKARLWKKLVHKLPFGRVAIYDRITEMLRDSSGALLDAGCGRGQLLLRFANQFNTLIGCDFSRVFIDDARTLLAEAAREEDTLRGRIAVVRHDLNRPLPWPDGTFDVVTAIAVLEHVFDPYAVLRELKRVLRIGGTLVIQVPNAAYLRHRLRLVCGRPLVTQLAKPDRWHIEGYDGGHIHYFTRSSLHMVLKECGFEVTDWAASGTLASMRSMWVSLCSGDLVCRAEPRSSSSQ